MNVKSVVNTASPGPMPRTIRAMSRAIRAGSAGNGMLYNDVPGEFFLEGGYLGTHDVLAMIEHSIDTLDDLVLDQFLLVRKVNKFHKWCP